MLLIYFKRKILRVLKEKLARIPWSWSFLHGTQIEWEREWSQKSFLFCLCLCVAHFLIAREALSAFSYALRVFLSFVTRFELALGFSAGLQHSNLFFDNCNRINCESTFLASIPTSTLIRFLQLYVCCIACLYRVARSRFRRSRKIMRKLFERGDENWVEWELFFVLLRTEVYAGEHFMYETAVSDSLTKPVSFRSSHLLDS